MFQWKEQDKTSEKELKETERSNSPGRVWNNKDAHWTQENGGTQPGIDKGIGTVRKCQTEAITEQKDLLEGSNHRLDEAEQESAAGDKQ